MTLLVVSGLSKAFSGVKAVEDVHFAIHSGEMVALIGPNGAGKSTCFNMIGGQLAPDGGEILLDGRSVVGLRPHRLFRMGMGRTFQIAATYPSMTVRENIQMAMLSAGFRLFDPLASAHHAHWEDADEILALVGITDLADCLCGTLAYGDIKRVELASVIADRPRLLLMDEPTAGMGGEERVALMALVRRLARALGMGVLFTEHDLDVVFGQSDRVMVMAQGKMVTQGRPAAVRDDPHVIACYLGTPAGAAAPASSSPKAR